MERFRLSQGFKPVPDAENEMRIAAWLEILGTANIPVKHYNRLYRRAMVTRGLKEAKNEQISFFVRPENLIAEYEILRKELASERLNVPTICPQFHDNEPDKTVIYLLGGITATVLPCHVCRKNAHEDAKKEITYVPPSPKKMLQLISAVKVSPEMAELDNRITEAADVFRRKEIEA